MTEQQQQPRGCGEAKPQAADHPTPSLVPLPASLRRGRRPVQWEHLLEGGITVQIEETTDDDANA